MKKLVWLLIVGCLFLYSGCSKQPTLALQSNIKTNNEGEPYYSLLPDRLIIDAPLSNEIEEMAQENTELLYKEYWLNCIPVLEVMPIYTTSSTPLVIFVHGLTSSKEKVSYTLTQIAKAGYHAISFDLPGHGNRSDGAYYFADILLQGEKDLSDILDYYASLNYDLDNYTLGGFSTGAIISIHYALSGEYTPRILFSVSGIADWSWIDRSLLLKGSYAHGEMVQNDADMELAHQQMDDHNIYGDFGKLSDTTVLLFHGKQDSTFPWEATKMFYDDLIEFGYNDIYLDLEENLDHEFSGTELSKLLTELEMTIPGDKQNN